MDDSVSTIGLSFGLTVRYNTIRNIITTKTCCQLLRQQTRRKKHGSRKRPSAEQSLSRIVSGSLYDYHYCANAKVMMIAIIIIIIMTITTITVMTAIIIIAIINVIMLYDER